MFLLSMLETRWESFLTLRRLLRTSSLASSDSQASLVKASPLVGLALAGGGLARSDQEPPSSADTEMVGAL